jgi:hypothetical protein
MTDAVSAQEALVHVMVTMCVADREMATVELGSIQALVDRLPVFEGFDRALIAKVADRSAALLKLDDGLDRIIDLVKTALPAKLYETAYALAVEVAAADVVARQEELRFLEMLRDAFELANLPAAAIEHSARVRYRRL